MHSHDIHASIFLPQSVFNAHRSAVCLSSGLHRQCWNDLDERDLCCAYTVRMKPLQSATFPFLLLAIAPVAAGVDPGEEFFEREIRPLLVEHCYDCHAGDERKGGLSLDSKSGWMRGGDSGKAIEPGNTESSLILEAVRYDNLDLQMPPRGKLNDQAIGALKTWVRMGAPDPRAPDPRASDTAMVTSTGLSGMSIEAGREFWSFRPVSRPLVPTPADPSRVVSPIDAFVLARLDQEGMTPAKPADKRTLIRRATQNLIGLPPTPEEVKAFLSDESPGAFRRLVERLLASPHYGVRWGRHWLDVARYADSNGLDENLGFGQAWRYRDYVIDAMNDDKPFDQFLIEQVAGDLLPAANRETRTATGFLALGAKVLAEQDRQKLEMDVIDEQLDTLGKAFLGMTFGCVRCHDHKFDPIKQTDYYSLAAILKSTKSLGDTNTGAIKHWYEHSFTDDEERERLEQVNAEIKRLKAAASSFKHAQVAKLRSEARARAADYLVAASTIEATASLGEVAAAAEPLGLHPRILRRCRLHLDFHRGDALFAAWHDQAAEGNLDGIREHYAALFAAAETAWSKRKKSNPKAIGIDDPKLEAARAALHDVSGFLAVPAKAEFAFDDNTLAEYHDLMTKARVFESQSPDETAAMGVADGEVVAELAVHIRGSYLNLGEAVPREFPRVMRLSEARPVFPDGSSGRLELARWMADSRHPLTARVIVNRVWGWHFGVPLVRSTENFGKLGDRPSHPDLLDWLAYHFMAGGWSIKDLNRLILNSYTYQMASGHADESTYRKVDPENRLIWKANVRRLEAEQIRDSLLAVSGRLDGSLGGKTLPVRNRQFVFNHTSEDHTRYDSLRRAAYLPVIRNHLYPWFEQFDFPDPTLPTGLRDTTVVAPQTLVMMNDPLVMDSAERFAEKLMAMEVGDDVCVQAAYQAAFARRATVRESQRAIRFIQQWSGEHDPMRAWSLFCHSLIASNEFLYLR